MNLGICDVLLELQHCTEVFKRRKCPLHLNLHLEDPCCDSSLSLRLPTKHTQQGWLSVRLLRTHWMVFVYGKN